MSSFEEIRRLEERVYDDRRSDARTADARERERLAYRMNMGDDNDD